MFDFVDPSKVLNPVPTSYLKPARGYYYPLSERVAINRPACSSCVEMIV